MKKTLGILGGMGPLATAKLFEDIILLTDAHSDQEHIPILIDNNISVPDRTDYILGVNNEDPRIELIKSAKRLEDMGADYIIMPCNTAHHFYKDIDNSIDIPFINMIEEAAKAISSYGDIKAIGIFSTEGTIKAKIYDDVFSKYGIEIISPSKENQRYITEIIYNIKEGIDQTDLEGFNKVLEEFRSKNVDGYIAGCTEMSVAIELLDLDREIDILDPMKILAYRAIEFAGKKIKED